MGFFDALQRVLGGGQIGADGLPIDRRLGDDLGLNEVGSGADDNSSQPIEGTSAFDRRLWERKLKRVLDELPGSRGEWDDLMVEAGALGFDAGWVAQRQRAEFALLVRRAVADRVITEPEHRKLDLARELIGLSNDEAEAVLSGVVAEVHAFFEKPAGGS
jgi:hypothetical protein